MENVERLTELGPNERDAAIKKVDDPASWAEQARKKATAMRTEKDPVFEEHASQLDAVAELLLNESERRHQMADHNGQTRLDDGDPPSPSLSQ